MKTLEGMLEFPCDVERLPNGNTLIADAGDETGVGSEILEVSPNGCVVWRYGGDLAFAHSAHLMKDGSILISDTSNDRVLSVSQSGEVVLDSDRWGGGTGSLSDGTHLRYPNDAKELPDGSILITDRNNDRCVVVDREGAVLRSFGEGIEHPHNADMLANGNLLLVNSDANRVVEVDRHGTEVWGYGDGSRDTLNFPRDADRLQDGNTLITDSRNHRVIEVTPDGKIVWEFRVDYYASFYEADGLSNGNVLISDQHHHRIIEVDRSGTIVWMFRNRRFWKELSPKLRNGFFTQWDNDGTPAGWYLYSRFAEGGGKTIGGEPGSAGIEYDRSGALCLVQYVAVKPGRHYTFSGRIRTEEVHPDKVAYFQLFFLDEYGGPVCNTAEAPKGNPFTGTTDWTQDTIEAIAPERARTVEIRLFLNGPGKAWMREVLFFA